MESPPECVAVARDSAGVESDGSTAPGEGVGEDSPVTPTIEPPPGFRQPLSTPCGPGTRAPRRPGRDVTPKSSSGQTPASSSGARPSSAQSTPVCAPPGLARPEPLLWSPFLGDVDAESRVLYTPASGSGEALPPLPPDPAEQGAPWELPFLLGNKGSDPYTPGETLRKTSSIGTAAEDEEFFLHRQGSQQSSLLVDSTEEAQGQVDSDLKTWEAFDEAVNAAHMESQTFDERTAPMQFGTEEMPTVGSAGHHLRACKPCAFVNTKGCKDGVACKFCHLCEPGEKKRRKKEKKAFQRAVNQWHRGTAGNAGWELAGMQLHT